MGTKRTDCSSSLEAKRREENATAEAKQRATSSKEEEETYKNVQSELGKMLSSESQKMFCAPFAQAPSSQRHSFNVAFLHEYPSVGGNRRSSNRRRNIGDNRSELEFRWSEQPLEKHVVYKAAKICVVVR